MTSLFSIGLFCFTNTAFQIFSFEILKMLNVNNMKIENKINEIQNDIKIQKEVTLSLLRINDTLFNKMKKIENELKEMKESICVMNDKFEELIEVDVEKEFNQLSSKIFNTNIDILDTNTNTNTTLENNSPKSVTSEKSDIVFL